MASRKPSAGRISEQDRLHHKAVLAAQARRAHAAESSSDESESSSGTGNRRRPNAGPDEYSSSDQEHSSPGTQARDNTDSMFCKGGTGGRKKSAEKVKEETETEEEQETDQIIWENYYDDREGMPCGLCQKNVYFAERSWSMGFPYHKNCLRCGYCYSILQPGSHVVHQNVPFCGFQCYNKIFASDGYRYTFNETRK